MLTRSRNSRPRMAMWANQRGASLIEVLISILLLSFGMLALAGMQAYSVTAQKNASYRTIASAMANELAELIRLNPAGLAAGNYDGSLMTNAGPPGLAPCAFPNCIATTLAADDLSSFRIRVRQQLPLGGVEVTRPAGSTTEANIWIVWEEPRAFDTAAGATGANEAQADNCSATARALPTLPRCFYMKVQL